MVDNTGGQLRWSTKVSTKGESEVGRYMYSERNNYDKYIIRTHCSQATDCMSLISHKHGVEGNTCFHVNECTRMLAHASFKLKLQLELDRDYALVK